MYTFESRIRYSEVDGNGVLRLPSLIDYLQDCSTFQSEDVGYGVRWLIDRGYAWVVNAWQIEIAALPELGDRVTIGTCPYEIRGFLGLRNFFMLDAQGSYLVRANSVWTFLNMSTGMPERAPEEMKTAYGLGEKLEMTYLPRKLPFPQEGETVSGGQLEVRAEHLDTNHHVNNGQYIRIAMDAAFGAEVPRVRRVRAEYKKQAHLADLFYPLINRRTTEEGLLVTTALNDADGAAYCTVEMTLEPSC